jgi:hypothetical protein
MDPDMAMSIIGQTDTLQNEPMNFRVGAELVRKIRTLLPDELTLNPDNKIYIPYFEKILYGTPAKDFLEKIIANIISEIPSDNEKVKRRFEEILNQAKTMYNKVHNDEEDEDEEDDYSTGTSY